MIVIRLINHQNLDKKSMTKTHQDPPTGGLAPDNFSIHHTSQTKQLVITQLNASMAKFGKLSQHPRDRDKGKCRPPTSHKRQSQYGCETYGSIRHTRCQGRDTRPAGKRMPKDTYGRKVGNQPRQPNKGWFKQNNQPTESSLQHKTLSSDKTFS